MEKFKNPVRVFHLIDGAKEATGLTVIIDVFRAFSLECYLYSRGAELIRPVGSVERAFELKEQIPGSVLIGERGGKKCEGFDFGNSPSTVPEEAVRGKTILHTTSAGTQGIVNAAGADSIITGSLVNAKAIARYIMEKQPESVSLVCMGNAGVAIAREDELCAGYIKSILEGEELPDMEERIRDLQYDGGEHFFDPAKREVFPEEDFWLCTKYNRFDFVIEVSSDELGYVSKKVEI